MSGRNGMIPGQHEADDATQTSQYTLTEFRPGDVLAERFRLEELLGVGGMGLVYKAHDTELNTSVALKLLRPELTASESSLQRFRNELLLARQISHPNVIRLHELMRHQQHWFITMDYVEGESLDRKLDRERKLTPEQAIDITRQIALGLAAADQMQVVHRDLKPANILIDQQGKVLISDFGVARSVSSSTLTQHGAMVGTPDYLSPEQAAGETVDHRSDLYTLGVMLCEMLTGKLPYSASTPTELLSQKLVSSPDPSDLRDAAIPAGLRQVCARLMKRTPGHRFQSAEDLIQVLDNLDSYTRQRRWRRSGAALAATALLLLIGFSIYHFWPTAPPEEQVQPAQIIDNGITILPFSSDAPQSITPAQAAAMSLWISQPLLNNLSIPIQPPYRTETVLQQLGYQPRQAREYLSQINELTGHARTIAGRIIQRDAAQVLVLELLDGQQVAWQTELNLAADQQQWQQQLADAAQTLYQQIADTAQAAWQPVLLTNDIEALNLYYQGQLDLTSANMLQARQPLLAATEQAPGLSAAWLALSNAQLQSGNWDDAYNSAERAALNVPDNDTRLRVFTDAWLAQLNGQYDQAIESLQNYLQGRTRDDEAEMMLAQVLGSAGQFDQAIERLRTLTINDPNHPRGWYELAKFSIQSGRARVAIDDYLVKALVIQNRLRNRQGQADVTNAMGVAYERLGQLDQAAVHYRQAAELRAGVNDIRGHATSLRNLAGILAIQGDMENAERHLLEAQEDLESLGDSLDLADLYNAIGFLDEERGNYTDALANYRRALQMRQSLNDPQGIAQSYSNIGFIYYQLNQTDNTLVYWLQAKEQFETIGDRAGQAQTLQLIALLNTSSGELDQARTLLQQAITLAEANQLSDEKAAANLSLAEVLRHTGQYRNALMQLDLAMTNYTQRDDRRGIVEAGILAAQIYNDLNTPESATSYLDETAINSSDNSDQQFRYLLAAAIRIGLAQRSYQAALPMLEQAAELTSAEKHGDLQLALARTEIALLSTDNGELPEALDETRIAGLIPSARAQSEWKLTQTAYWLTARFYARRDDADLLMATLNGWQREADNLPGKIWPLRRQLLQQQFCSLGDGNAPDCADIDTLSNDALIALLDDIPAEQQDFFLRSVWIPQTLANAPIRVAESP